MADVSTSLNGNDRASTIVFERPEGVLEKQYQWCPGCSYGISQRLVGEVLDDLSIRDRSVLVAGVGCHSAFIEHVNCHAHLALHGRAAAVATGMKRAQPDLVVFTVQGDGDIAGIGGNEILHAAARGDCLTVIFLNNGVYGETGGQESPTTLLGMRTTTSREGREAATSGSPLHMTEILATCEGVGFAARVAHNAPGPISASKKILRAAFENQLEGNGLSIVEVLSACPTHWAMTPEEAMNFVGNQVAEEFPLGIIKNTRSAASGSNKPNRVRHEPRQGT
jgi:2-oxoglutarate/2-oxoacid ferredoxin oxidoreductase subunit beta